MKVVIDILSLRLQSFYWWSTWSSKWEALRWPCAVGGARSLWEINKKFEIFYISSPTRFCCAASNTNTNSIDLPHWCIALYVCVCVCSGEVPKVNSWAFDADTVIDDCNCPWNYLSCVKTLMCMYYFSWLILRKCSWSLVRGSDTMDFVLFFRQFFSNCWADTRNPFNPVSQTKTNKQTNNKPKQ